MFSSPLSSSIHRLCVHMNPLVPLTCTKGAPWSSLGRTEGYGSPEYKYPLEIRPLQLQTVISLFCWAYLLRWFVFTSVTHMFLHCFPITSCQSPVYSVIFSPKAVHRVSCPFFRPKMFSPSDRVWYHSRTLGAQVLATVWGLHQMGRSLPHSVHTPWWGHSSGS